MEIFSGLKSDLRTAVILPAFNEAGRIGDVLRAVSEADLVHEIIVVCDGCTDQTATEARQTIDGLEGTRKQPFTLYDLQKNVGKGGAMAYGAHRTDADILLFLDADLIGLQHSHVDALLQPMLDSDEPADMTLGLFGTPRGGVFGWWLGTCHRVAASLTGQRAIRRDVFFSIPELTCSRFGVEVAITHYVQSVWKLRVQPVRINGVTHPIKEEKIGVWRGFRHRLNMYGEIAKYLITDTIRNRASAQRRDQNLQIKERLTTSDE
jgi:hypothetical protein